LVGRPQRVLSNIAVSALPPTRSYYNIIIFRTKEMLCLWSQCRSV